MSSARGRIANEKGFTLFYMAVVLVTLLLFTGLAVDGGRVYVVRAQLTKAVDGAALGAARMLNSGNPRSQAAEIFEANFPAGWMGTTWVTPTSDASFFTIETDETTGVNRVRVTAAATLPTTFMSLGTIDQVTVTSVGEATRRMVDLSLVLDVSSSIGWRWPYVRDAARSFVNAFDAAHDRMSLVFYGNGAKVLNQMRDVRGFDKAGIIANIPNGLPGGSTAMVQGLYRGWDEVRAVPNGQQSGLRIIVLFTDGCSNSVPGIYPGNAAARGLRTWDFPDRNDPDNQTHNNPRIDGLYPTEIGTFPGSGSPGVGIQPSNWNNTCAMANSCIPTIPFLPPNTTHAERRSGGIPTTFPLQTNQLTVDGMPQTAARGLRNWNAGANRFPAEVYNINNAARNLVEIIANAARSDAAGDYPIRIYSIGMGELIRLQLGTRPEMAENILKRVANDKSSVDFNANQQEGKYYYAATVDDVGDAFNQLQNQIIRLTK